MKYCTTKSIGKVPEVDSVFYGFGGEILPDTYEVCKSHREWGPGDCKGPLPKKK